MLLLTFFLSVTTAEEIAEQPKCSKTINASKYMPFLWLKFKFLTYIRETPDEPETKKKQLTTSVSLISEIKKRRTMTSYAVI